ncbi:MAG: ACP S-malonyltransferase, partial [Clostridia bacterium]|nr:ACP S-malonyltransferase [Clostridia bacterium]
AMALRAHGVQPAGAAGFSLGEYAALAFAGAMPVGEAFEIIQIRADAMQAAVAPGDGAMAAMIGGDSDAVEAVCAEVKSGYVVAANYNCPTQTVISGEAAAVDEAIALAAARRIRAKKLPVSAPFHCALMKPAADRLAALFAEKRFAAPSVPVYMNVDAEPNADAARIPDLLVRQAMSPVRWAQTLRRMQADGFDTFIECGPGHTLTGLARKTLEGVALLRVGDAESLRQTLEALGK